MAIKDNNTNIGIQIVFPEAIAMKNLEKSLKSLQSKVKNFKISFDIDNSDIKNLSKEIDKVSKSVKRNTNDYKDNAMAIEKAHVQALKMNKAMDTKHMDKLHASALKMNKQFDNMNKQNASLFHNLSRNLVKFAVTIIIIFPFI